MLREWLNAHVDYEDIRLWMFMMYVNKLLCYKYIVAYEMNGENNRVCAINYKYMMLAKDWMRWRELKENFPLDEMDSKILPRGQGKNLV